MRRPTLSPPRRKPPGRFPAESTPVRSSSRDTRPTVRRAIRPAVSGSVRSLNAVLNQHTRGGPDSTTMTSSSCRHDDDVWFLAMTMPIHTPQTGIRLGCPSRPAWRDPDGVPDVFFTSCFRPAAPTSGGGPENGTFLAVARSTDRPLAMPARHDDREVSWRVADASTIKRLLRVGTTAPGGLAGGEAATEDVR